MKKILARVLFLLLIVSAIYACREDNLGGITKTQKESRDAQFFNTDVQNLTLLQQKAFQHLEEKNQETNFVTSLEDIKGLPQWETLKFLNSNSNENNTSKNSLEFSNGDGLYSVPLTKDGEITSILYFEVKNEQVVTTREIKNLELWSIINNKKIALNVREFLLFNCLQYDKELFGNYLFINIPTGLFGIKEDMPHKVRMDTQYNASQKLVATRTCIEFILNCTCTGGVCDECDDNGQCVPYRFCLTSDGGGSNGNDDGGGGSSNGGTGNSSGDYHATGGGGYLPDENGSGNTGGGSNPKDPCTESPEQFYRIAPHCGGSGGNDNNFGNNDTPCEKGKTSIQKTQSVYNNPDVKQGMINVLKNKVHETQEWAIAVGKKNDGTYSFSPAEEGGATQANMPSNQIEGDYVGNGHSHAGGRGVPSGGDIYSMLTDIRDNDKFSFAFVFGEYYASDETHVPETYALNLEDKIKVLAFLQQYPRSENYDPATHEFKKNSVVGKIFFNAKKDAYTNTNNNYTDDAIAMAYVLDKLDVGINLSKSDNNGILHKITTSLEEVTIPFSGGKKEIKLVGTPCP